MHRGSTTILLRLAILGFVITTLWQLTTYLPVDHAALQVLEVPSMLGAAVVFMAGFAKLRPFYRRLRWTPWDFFHLAQRHHAAWLAGLCALCFLYACYAASFSFAAVFMTFYSLAILALYLADKEEQAAAMGKQG